MIASTSLPRHPKNHTFRTFAPTIAPSPTQSKQINRGKPPESNKPHSIPVAKRLHNEKKISAIKKKVVPLHPISTERNPVP